MKASNTNSTAQSTSRVSDELAHFKLKAFGSQMNPHFIFNSLNAIQHFITSENKKSAVLYLSVFSKLIRYYIRNIEKEAVLITEEFAMLHAYLKLQKLRYTHQFDYSIDYQEDAGKNAPMIPSFIVQPLFENIIEHAIYNRYENYRLTATFKVGVEKVEVSIVFTYSTIPNKPLKYIPDYREQMVNWQEQIRLLNRLKNYNIKKKVTFNNDSNQKGGTILLSLPNLK